MPDTFYIGSDITSAEPIHIFCEEDFARMVDERLGRDAGNYVRTILAERNDGVTVQELEDQIEALKSELSDAENRLDDLTKADDMLDAIQNVLDGR